MSQEKKKGVSTKPAQSTKGACRTRTYTRWGKRQAIQLAESSGAEASDLDEMDNYTDDDGDQSLASSINMSLGVVNSPSYDCVQRENIISESIRRSDISQQPKPAETVTAEKTKGKQKSRTRLITRNPVMARILKGTRTRNNDVGSSLNDYPEAHDEGTELELDPTLEKDTEFISEDGEIQGAQAVSGDSECIINTNDAMSLNAIDAGSASIESIMTEMCNVVDLASISVYQEHDLTVTSITDAAPASHVLIADPNTESSDLTSLIDIQSLLASYSTGQPVILATCSKDETLAEEATACTKQAALLERAMPEEYMKCSQEEDLTEEPVVYTHVEAITEEAMAYTPKCMADGATVWTPKEAPIEEASPSFQESYETEEVEEQVRGDIDGDGNSEKSSAEDTRQYSSNLQDDSFGVSSKTGVEHVQIIENLQSFDISGISNTGEEAGFHDYCISSDSVRLLQNSSELDIECHGNNDITLSRDKIQPVESVFTASPNQPDVSQPNISSFNIKKATAVAHEINCDEHVGASTPEIVQEYFAETSEELTGATQEEEGEMAPSYWKDTHIMIIKRPHPEDPVQGEEHAKTTPDDNNAKRVRVQCTWCAATYSRPEQLRAHAKDAHPEQTFSCRFCSRRFVEEDKCEDHMDWCRIGEKVTGRYRCPQCVYSATKSIFVVKHYRTEHTTKHQKTCDDCHQVFKTPDDYFDHQLQRHDDAEKIGRKKVHCCQVCNFRTVKLYLFKSHESLHSDERFPCKTCSKSFKTVLILKAHENKIHSDKITKCSECTFTSKYVATVKAHEYRTHNITSDKQTVYHCHYCNYSNVDRATLRKHERFKHSDEKSFLCSSCPKAFKHKNQLTVHERVHTGARPFPCQLCPYAGRSRVALLTHHNHRHSDAKPYVCDMCGFQTKCASNLWLHKVRCKKKHSGETANQESPEYALKPTVTGTLSNDNEES